MKGQISTELLVIVALIMLVFIPLLTMIYFKVNEANSQMESYESELAVVRLAYIANSVGSLGTDTTIYTDVYIPRNMQKMHVNSSGEGGELIMKLSTPDGVVEVVEVITHNVENNDLLDEGEYGWVRFRVESEHVSSGKAQVTIEKV